VVLGVIGVGGTRRRITFGMRWEEGGDMVYEIRGGDTVGEKCNRGRRGEVVTGRRF
jgi:hypothetical protein